MDIIGLILLIAIFSGARFRKKITNGEDIFSREQTLAINGMFSIFIFIRHFIQYTEIQDCETIIRYIDVKLDQMIVVSFLFFSGYGIRCQILRRGKDYVNTILYNRVFKTWIRFAIVVILYVLVSIIKDKHYSIKEIGLAFLGLLSIGNSTWYIVAILYLWIFTFFAFKYFKNSTHSYLSLVLLMIIYALFFYSFRTAIWYNTIIAYLLGMLFCDHRKKLELKFGNNIVFHMLCFFALINLTFFTHKHGHFFLFELWVFSFCVIIILMNYLFQIQNKVITWIGNYALELYLLQRIPMILLNNYITNNCIYFILCAIITGISSLIFKKACIKLDSKLNYVKLRRFLYANSPKG